MPAEDRTATQTLQERACQKIERALQASQAPRPRVLWWDAEGHLQSVLREAMSALGAGITVADGNPLTLRREALEEPQDRTLWYVPEAKEGRDWFRDIREAGDDTEITCSIYDLSAELYGASPWQLLHRDTADANGSVAALLQDELTTQPLPGFQDLRTKLLTKGRAGPRNYSPGGMEQPGPRRGHGPRDPPSPRGGPGRRPRCRRRPRGADGQDAPVGRRRLAAPRGPSAAGSWTRQS